MSESLPPVPLPEVMLRRLAREDAAADRAAEVAAADEADRSQMVRRMAELSSHYHEAVTGHSLTDWEHARSAIAQAAGDAGRDRSAALGSPQNPEVLVAGESLARPEVSRSRADAAEAELRRARELSADPLVARMRAASRRAEISRLEAEAAAAPPRRARGRYPRMSRSSPPARANLAASRAGGGYAGLHPGVVSLASLPYGRTRGS